VTRTSILPQSGDITGWCTLTMWLNAAKLLTVEVENRFCDAPPFRREVSWVKSYPRGVAYVEDAATCRRMPSLGVSSLDSGRSLGAASFFWGSERLITPAGTSLKTAFLHHTA